MKIIYDVGSNNGDDIPYYLKKSDLVVAVEADPSLAALIRGRFSAEIASGRVVVENYVITVAEQSAATPFYIHKGHHVLSQFGRPAEDRIDQFEETHLPSKRLVQVIEQYGTPHYVKIDVEGYDQDLLEDLFSHRIFPPYLSAESHSIKVFTALVSLGRYKAFKLVDGPSIPHTYGRHTIRTTSGAEEHAFPDHSAGPFGNDINGGWEGPESFFRTLASAGLGWKDIHVSNVDLPER